MSAAELTLISLAVHTGIPASTWAAEPPGWADAAVELILSTRE